MENMINIGIDLGTTNSAIAKFVKGEVVIFNNPQDYGRSTLPSVVSFRKAAIYVGKKAKELQTRDPKNTLSVFKRKMGTSETFKIKSLGESKTPIDLSAIVLKELKTFLPPGETLDAAVITIPAAFDTTQSNATKQAGLLAGFKQVILLQEPIAASLAYANLKKEKDLADGQWLVYDFGGGTFDVALVRIKDGEMSIVDHEGDNFLGGADLDESIVEKLIFPQLQKSYTLKNLSAEMKDEKGKYNANWFVLKYKAEEAKIELSARTSTEIEVSGFVDDNDEEIDLLIEITRTELNDLVKPFVDSTLGMVRAILTRNTLKSSDIQFTLMVGGSTFIPFVRQRVEEALQIPIKCDIDPTTAVAVGAAYYAATKPRMLETQSEKANSSNRISVRAAYQKASKEKEELFSAKIQGDLGGLFFRIKRDDGGFDSGLRVLSERINEDLPLVENSYNYFTFLVYDIENNIIPTDLEVIGINSGFGISGQPLPLDICLELDDEEAPGLTKLSVVFHKNSILPLKKTLERTLNKTVLKGTTDQVLKINVLEGPYTSLPAANKQIGYFEITGKQLTKDVLRGSDIEITLQMSESRDLTVAAYLRMADQEFKQQYNITERTTNVSHLKWEISDLQDRLNDEIDQATESEEFEVAKELTAIKREISVVATEADSLAENDVTDNKYKIEDRKRKLAQAIDNATKDKRISQARVDYQERKERCERLILEYGNDYERKCFNDIVAQEPTFLSSKNVMKIQERTSELHSIASTILWRTPEFLIRVFKDLLQQSPRMNDQGQVKSLIEAARLALDNQNWERLSDINSSLLNLLPKPTQKDDPTIIGFY